MIPCGRTMGHGVSCQEGYLCGNCTALKEMTDKAVAELVAIAALFSGNYDHLTCKEFREKFPRGGAEKASELKPCEACGGDGIETCDNPDHGFINGIGGEIGRLGCPGCGSDPDHKTGQKCPECGGTGEMADPCLRCKDMPCYDISGRIVVPCELCGKTGKKW